MGTTSATAARGQSQPPDASILGIGVAAVPVPRDAKQGRAKLHDIMTRNIDRAVLRVVYSALRQMNENISSIRRVAAFPARYVPKARSFAGARA
jgi:hypothetical protein